VPLATCFDYAAKPRSYDPEASWRTVIKQRFGTEALAYWQTIRWFLETSQQLIKAKHSLRISAAQNAITIGARLSASREQAEMGARDATMASSDRNCAAKERARIVIAVALR